MTDRVVKRPGPLFAREAPYVGVNAKSEAPLVKELPQGLHARGKLLPVFHNVTTGIAVDLPTV